MNGAVDAVEELGAEELLDLRFDLLLHLAVGVLLHLLLVRLDGEASVDAHPVVRTTPHRAIAMRILVWPERDCIAACSFATSPHAFYGRMMVSGQACGSGEASPLPHAVSRVSAVRSS